jgi:hypothetical protein
LLKFPHKTPAHPTLSDPFQHPNLQTSDLVSSLRRQALPRPRAKEGVRVREPHFPAVLEAPMLEIRAGRCAVPVRHVRENGGAHERITLGTGVVQSVGGVGRGEGEVERRGDGTG